LLGLASGRVYEQVVAGHSEDLGQAGDLLSRFTHLDAGIKAEVSFQ